MKHILRFILVPLLAMTLSACDLFGPPSPSLAELEATAMANAQANLALTMAAMPTDTPWPTPTMVPPTPIPLTFLPQQPFIVPAQTATPPSSAGANQCNVVMFNPSTVDVTIPDGTTLVTGQKFTKTWQIYNGGTCTWTTDYQLAFVLGDQMGGPDAVPLSAPVLPGHGIQISVRLTADSQPAIEAVGNWRMKTDSGQAFGSYLTVEINVNQAPDATSAPDTTPTATVTPTP